MRLLLRRIDAAGMTCLFYLGPPVTMIMAWAAFGDVLRPMDAAGLVITFVGVLIAQKEFSGLIRTRMISVVKKGRPAPESGRPFRVTFR